MTVLYFSPPLRALRRPVHRVHGRCYAPRGGRGCPGGVCRAVAPGRSRSTAVGYHPRARPSLLPTTRAPDGLR